VSPRIPIRLLAVQSDERLARLAREGQERAFEALVHRYRRPLLRYCRRLGLSDSRAEDALQVALLNAWQALARGTEVREPGPWLYRIAHNAAISAMRSAGERDADLARAGALAGLPVAEDGLERRIALSDALTSVAALPDMQRQALVLAAIEGKTHDEVAGALGIEQQAVRGLLYRARSTLRSAAAVLPQPLIGWAYGNAGTASERASEAVSAGGTLAATGVLIKGATLAITAGALIGAAAIVPHGHHSTRARDARAHLAVPGQVGLNEPPGAAASAAVTGAQSRPQTLGAIAPHGVRPHNRPAAPRNEGLGAPPGAGRLARDGPGRRVDQGQEPADRQSEGLARAGTGELRDGGERVAGEHTDSGGSGGGMQSAGPSLDGGSSSPGGGPAGADGAGQPASGTDGTDGPKPEAEAPPQSEPQTASVQPEAPAGAQRSGSRD
jgi:RNA polymerase sigma factor (sigma-70 family)